VCVIDTIIFFCYFKAWEAHNGIRIEGNFLTCEYVKHCPQCKRGKGHRPGARFLKRFSKEFPHFEVSNDTDTFTTQNPHFLAIKM